MPQLERSLGLAEVTLMSVGIILGAGIYVLIGEAAGLSGNSLWLSFVIAALVASFTGLSYAELSSRYPEAGAEYVYVKQTFGSRVAWLIGWLIVIGGVVGSAAVAIGFGNYFSAVFDTPTLAVSLGALIIISIILIAGIKETAFFTIIFTLIEAAGLFIIIIIGMPEIGSVDYTEMAHGFSGVLEAGILIFFSYIGFESITRLAEETRDAGSNIPRAIVLSIGITTILYILVGVTAISVVGWEALAEADAPLALVAKEVFGEESFLLLSLIALFSTFNTVLVMLLSASRMVYGIADQNALPRLFLRIWPKTRTPWVAIVAVTGSAILFLSLGDLKTIANLTNFTIFVVFITVNASVIALRYRDPVTRGFRVPISVGTMPILPLLGILTCLFMVVNLSWTVLALGGGLIALGLAIHALLERQRRATMH
jgi:APA family basic amino acid/polyamine antiporter